jgi:hypothetical protein
LALVVAAHQLVAATGQMVQILYLAQSHQRAAVMVVEPLLVTAVGLVVALVLMAVRQHLLLLLELQDKETLGVKILVLQIMERAVVAALAQ